MVDDEASHTDAATSNMRTLHTRSSWQQGRLFTVRSVHAAQFQVDTQTKQIKTKSLSAAFGLWLVLSSGHTSCAAEQYGVKANSTFIVLSRYTRV